MDGFGSAPPRRVAASDRPAAGRAGRSAAAGPHRAIYWIIIALCGWLVLSVWGFVGRGYTWLALAVVSLFVLIAVAIPLILWAISRRHRRPGEVEAPDESFAEWLTQEFDTDTGRTRATVATIEILLPIAAVSFGMTIFALVRLLDGVV